MQEELNQDEIYTTPCIPCEERNIYTEGINYFDPSVCRTAIWGPGDADILSYLKNNEFKGRWLNLACGDGRYSNELLCKADEVIAADIDRSATSKLVYTTPPELRPKLDVLNFDITSPFPLENESVDGIFCTGILHLFPRYILPQILNEIKRVAGRSGCIFFDFATDIQRYFLDGTPYLRQNEPAYSYAEAIAHIKSSFAVGDLVLSRSEVPLEVVSIADRTYTFESQLILVTSKRKSMGSSL